RFILPAASSKRRRPAILSASHSASARPSPCVTPTRMAKPRPVRPTTSPLTVTLACRTRWIKARTHRKGGRAQISPDFLIRQICVPSALSASHLLQNPQFAMVAQGQLEDARPDGGAGDGHVPADETILYPRLHIANLALLQ